MAITLARFNPQQIAEYKPRITAIFRAAFTPPPYHKPEAEVADFADSLLTQLDRPAYRFAAALDAESGELAGFAYGYASTASPWWYAHVRAAADEETARAWLDHSFQFTELAVDPRWQGQGIGSRLHDFLLDGVGYERAVLSTLQADTPAHHLYRSRGWVVLLQDLFFPEIPRRYQIMGKQL